MNDMRRMHGGAYVQFVLYCQRQQQQQANEYGDDPSFLLSIAIYSYTTSCCCSSCLPEKINGSGRLAGVSGRQSTYSLLLLWLPVPTKKRRNQCRMLKKEKVTHVNISFCILKLYQLNPVVGGFSVAKCKCLSYGRWVHKLSHSSSRKICCLSSPPFVTEQKLYYRYRGGQERSGRVSYRTPSAGSPI